MRSLYVVLLIFIALPVVGQKRIEISGKLIDGQINAPLEFASVSLLNPADSSLIGGDVTTATGEFSIEADPGVYILKIQFISYLTKFHSVDARNGSVNIGAVTLKQDVETLSEVVVTGQKAQMRLELDKRIFNVSEDLNNIGANASQILDNLPSISVDVDGNVALRGSQNVRILINGKPSGLVGLSSPDALRQLQGNLIERIEVVTNPSARYEAEGSAGIINIILKKARSEGFNGSVTLNTGWPHDHGLSLNGNYLRSWYNVFLNYGISYDESPGGGSSFQRFTFPDTTYYTRRDRDRTSYDWSNTLRIGSEFFIGDNSTLTASFLTKISDEENNSTITYEDFSSQDELVNNRRRREIEIEEDDNYEVELNYRKSFENEEQEFTAAFQYRLNDEIETGDILETDLLNDGSVLEQQRSINDQSNSNAMLQADYSHPLGDDKKFETGYRGTYQQIVTSYNVDTLNEMDEWVEHPYFTNEFQYDEIVNSAYAIFEHKMDAWGYQLGLRAEYTYIDIFQPQQGINDKKKYLNLFPSAFLSYKLTDLKSIQTSYSRRLSRPRFWYLNPFFSIADDRNIRTGNIDLNPEFTDSYEIGYLQNMNKSSFYFGAFYRHTTDVIERVSYPQLNMNNEIIFFSMPQNLSTENAYGLEMNFTLDPADWVSINGNANFYRAMTNGSFDYTSPVNDQLEVIDLSRDTYTANFRLNSRFTLGKYNIQLSGRYNAPEEDTQGSRRAIYTADLGMSREVFNNNGTLTLSIRDLFNTRLYRGTNEGTNWYEESEFRWRQRQINLSFTYRINRQNDKPDRRGDRENEGYDGGGGEDMDF